VPQAVVFAGVDHGNGSSQISASVAEMLSVDTARPVCLVEANFRSPGLANLFQVAPTPGLTDSLVHPEPLGTFARAVGQNLWLLTAGTITANSASLLSSDRLRERLTELRNTFDFIVIDAPPLSQYSDATMLGKLSDGLVIVIEADSTRKKVASAVTETLRSLHIPILAAVLNKRTFPIPKAIYKRM
jgi:receptor protein-tyrosine kinase